MNQRSLTRKTGMRKIKPLVFFFQKHLQVVILPSRTGRWNQVTVVPMLNMK